MLFDERQIMQASAKLICRGSSVKPPHTTDSSVPGTTRSLRMRASEIMRRSVRTIGDAGSPNRRADRPAALLGRTSGTVRRGGRVAVPTARPGTALRRAQPYRRYSTLGPTSARAGPPALSRVPKPCGQEIMIFRFIVWAQPSSAGSRNAPSGRCRWRPLLLVSPELGEFAMASPFMRAGKKSRTTVAIPVSVWPTS